MSNERTKILNIKLLGDELLLDEMRGYVEEKYQILNVSQKRPNSREPGVHQYFTIVGGI